MGAVTLYEQVLAQRPVPVVRFNLAVALIELGRWRDAYRQLAPIAKDPALGDRAAEAERYLAKTRAHLGRVTFTAAPEVTIEIDGERVGPERASILASGSHAVVARRPGYQPYTKTLVIAGGEELALAVDLRRDTKVRPVRRWSPVGPWLVVGLGAAITITGGVTFEIARREVASIEDDLATQCAAGCATVPADLARDADRQHRRQRIGVGALIGGGAVTLVGLTLAYLNRERLDHVVVVVANEGTFFGLAGNY